MNPKRFFPRLFGVVSICILSASSGFGQIAAWNFTGVNSPATANSTTSDALLVSVPILTRGPGAPASNANNSFRTTGFQNNGISTANTDYFQFTIQASAGNRVSIASISATLVGTSTFSASPGVSNQFAYSLDGINFTLIGSPSIRIGNGPIGPIDTSAIAALQNVSPSTTITFRFYASGQTTTGGWGFDGALGLVVSGAFSPDNPNAPVITGFSPLAGVAGTPVSIAGTNFAGATNVLFGSVSAGSFTVGSATNIQATVPSGAVTGLITVATPIGTNSSAQSFIIIDGSGSVTLQNGGAGSFSGRNLFGRSLSGQIVRLAYAPPSSGTVEGLRVTVPSEFGAPLSANVSVTGTGSAGAVVGVSGQVITITGLSASSPNSINVDISGLSTPDTSTPITNNGRYAFSVESRGSGGTFTALASQPSASVLIPLANARNADPVTFVPVLLNQLVAVEGVCVAGRLGSGATSTMLQDGSLGIALYSLSAVTGPQTRGNRYAAAGTIAQFNGVVQVVLSDPALLVDLGAATEPATTTVSVTEFNTNGVAYQSRVIRIENLSFVSGTWAVNQNVVLQDPSANQVTIRIQQNSTATTAPTFPVTVTGIGGQFDNASPFNTGFQLQPRDPADLTSATLPSISVNPTSLTSLTATQGNFGPSTNFVVNASSLTNNISVTANDAVNFAISTNNTDFTNTLSLPTNSSGAVTNASVFVRLTGAAPAGAKSNTVSLVSGSVSTNVSVSGTVIDPTAPNITANPIALSNFTALRGTVSSNQNVTITGTNLGGSNIAVASSNNFYEISTNSFATPGSNSLSLASTGGVVAVRISTNAPATNSLLGNLALSGGGATNNMALSGVVTNPPPSIMVSTNILPVFTGNTNQVSAIQSFTAGGSNLSNNITVTAPAGFTLSFVESPFAALGSLILSNETGSATNRVLYVRMNAFTSVTNIPATNITLTTIGASNAVTISGSVTAAPPSLIATPANLTNFSTVTGTASSAQSYVLSGSNLSTVSVTAPAGFQVALTNTNSAFGNSVSPAVSGGLLNTNIFVRVSAGSATNTNLTGNITNLSGTAATNVSLRARVLPVPTLVATPTALSNFSTITGITSTNQSFTLSANNLLGPVTLSVTNGYEISFATNSGFATNLTVSLADASDDAGNYSSGWTNGANGGTGFGPWTVSSDTSPPAYYAGAFVGDPTFAGITGFGTNAFGLYANPAGTPATVSVDRPFLVPLRVGETFSFQWAVNWDAGGGNKGFNVYSGGTSGAQLVNVNQGGFPGDITFNGTNAVTNFGTGPMTWSFTMTSLTNLFVTSTARDGSTNIVFSTNISVSGPPDVARWYTTAMTAGDQRQSYFNNLRIGFQGVNIISNLPVYVRIGTNAPIAEETNSLISRVNISSTNAADAFVDLSGAVADQPTISVSTNALTDLSATNGYPGFSTNFLVSGRNLTNDIVLSVSPSDNYQISTNNFSFTNTVSLFRSNGIVSSTTVFVRIAATAPLSTNPNSLSGTIALSSPSVSTNVSLSGQVLEDVSIPVVEVSTNSLTGLGSVEGSSGASTNFFVSGRNLRGDISLSVSNGLLALSTNNLDFGSTVGIARNVDNMVVSNSVYVRITDLAPVSGVINSFLGNVVIDTARNSNNQPAPTNVAVFGTVTNWSVANPFGIRVTNPPVGLSTEAASFLYRGQIGTALSGSVLRWLNVESGQSNFFAEGTNWTWSASVPLVAGNNMVTFSGRYEVNAGQTNVASDSPADEAYSGGWSTGENGGDGFGPWQLASDEGLSRLFIANVWDGVSTNMNVSGFYGFALEAIVGGSATAYRPFLGNMQAPGGSFNVYFDSNDVQPGGTVGLHLVDSNRVPLFTFAAVNDGSGVQFSITDLDGSRPAGWAYSSSGFLLEFSMTETNRYHLSATATNAGVAVTNTNGGPISASPISGVVFFDDSSGSPAAHNFYVGAMQLNGTVYRMETAETVAPDVERLVNPGSAYDLWAQGFGLDPSTSGSPGADPDMDSFNNELEYAFGTSPIAPDAALLDIEHNGASVAVSYVARKAGVDYALMQKRDLAEQVPGWTDTGRVPSEDSDQSGVLNPAEYVRMIFSAPAPAGRDFYRVRATITE